MTIDFAGSEADTQPVVPLGLAKLIKMAFDGADFRPLWDSLFDRVNKNPADAAALMDLSTIAYIAGSPGDRTLLQNEALGLQRIYRQEAAVPAPDGIRLLALVAPGNFLANTPLEFLLEGTSVTMDMVYVLPGQPLPHPLPEHDVALVAITELEENQSSLRELAALFRSWSRPVVNAPELIARLTRDGAWALLKSTPGVIMPMTARIARADFARIADGGMSIESVLVEPFPIIARPLDSHAGEGLDKLDDRAAIEAYLQKQPEAEFFISPFVDYSGPDGMFRKYRVALIEGRPFASHMGVSEHWMIHYVNAAMYQKAERRAEEARWMDRFEHEFAHRHQSALAAIAQRIGLEYVTMDCAETQDGKLLIFEAGNGMVVHAMDSAELFPYKRPQMDKIFRAFEAMLRNACKRQRPAADVAA